MWYRITRDLTKKRIKNSQSLYDVGETTAEEYVTADQEIPSCEAPVNTTLPNWRQRLRDEALDLYQKESEEPASKVVVVAEEDEEDQDVDFEPPAPTIKSTTEALRLVDDLKEFASTTLQDEILVSKLSSVAIALRILNSCT